MLRYSRELKDNYFSRAVLRLGVLFTLLFLASCASFVSPSRVQPTDLEGKIKELQTFHREELGVASRMKVIGHGAGSFRHYPMDLVSSTKDKGVRGNNGLFTRAKALPVSDLIRNAFEKYGLDAVEIDVQVPPKARGRDGKTARAFIMHNTPKWDAVSRPNLAAEYMQKNSLESVLQEFVKHGYHQGKVLYLELKSTAECQKGRPLSKKCQHYIDTVSDIIQPFLGADYSKERSWLRLISFSPYMLSSIRNSLEGNASSNTRYELIVGYTRDWIWGTNWIKACLAQSKGPVPEFNQTMKNFIINNTFIDRVWFSVKGIRNPGNEFAEVIRSRKETESPLEMNVAVYDVGNAKYRRRLREAKLPISSIMLDIDEPQ